MDELMRYINWMEKNAVTVTADRLRAGQELSKAIESAVERGIVSTYVDIAQEMGFDRTNIPQHKAGTRPMNREVVLRYAEVLQCEPETIADDEVRMELARDLQRYENDSLQYAVIREYEATKSTPLKLPRDMIESEGFEPSELQTVRIKTTADCGGGLEEAVVVWNNSEKPINSGELHVLAENHNYFVASIIDAGDGYIITAEKDSTASPSFKTKDQLMTGSTIVVGQVFLRLKRRQ